MDVHGQALDQRLGEEGAGKGHATDEQRDRDHLGVHRAGKPEGRKLGQPDADGDDGIGRDHGGAFESRRHQQREQDDAGADGAAGERPPAERCGGEPAVGEREPAPPHQPAQRHAQQSALPPMTSAAPVPVSMV